MGRGSRNVLAHIHSEKKRLWNELRYDRDISSGFWRNTYCRQVGITAFELGSCTPNILKVLESNISSLNGLPKGLLIEVTEQVKRFDRDIRARDAALEKAPEILKAVGGTPLPGRSAPQTSPTRVRKRSTMPVPASKDLRKVSAIAKDRLGRCQVSSTKLMALIPHT